MRLGRRSAFRPAADSQCASLECHSVAEIAWFAEFLGTAARDCEARVGWFVAAEDLQLQANPIGRAEGALDESSIATLARAASESHEVVERNLLGRIATLEAQALRYQTAIDAIAQGFCFFDGEERLILSNRRFAAIYQLAPEQVRPGMRLREIVELRVTAGTSPIAAEDYLALAASVKSDDCFKHVDRRVQGRAEHFKSVARRCPTAAG